MIQSMLRAVGPCAAVCALVPLLAGCASTDLEPLAEYYDHAPRTILVLPASNLSTEAEATWLFSATLDEALVDRGYYVLPPLLVSEIFTHEGIPWDDSAWGVDPMEVQRYLGVDALLYVTIEEWDTVYAVVASSVTVTLDYRLVDAHTGEELWHQAGRREVSAGGHSDGLAGLIASAIESAISAASTDYIDLALEVNREALGHLPPGAYHPAYAPLQEEIRAFRQSQAQDEPPPEGAGEERPASAANSD